MKNTLRSTLAALMAVLALGLCACGDPGSVVSGPGVTAGSGTSGSAGEGQTNATGDATGFATGQTGVTGGGSGAASGNAGSRTVASAGKNSTTRGAGTTATTRNSASGSQEPQQEELPVKNMNGRTFTFAAPSWDIVDLESAWVKTLAEKYNCKFENLQLSSDYTTLYSSIMAGDPIADVVVFNYTTFYTAVKRGFLRDLTNSQYIDHTDTEQFIPASQELLTTVNDKLYGLIDTYAFRRVLVYNRSLITGSDDLQTLQNNGQLTWDKLREVLQKVVDAGKQGIAGKMNENDVLSSFILANGGRYVSRNGLTFTYTLDTQNTRDAINYVQELQQGGLIMPMDGGNYLYPQTQFCKGRVSMMIADGWNLDYIASNAKFDYGIVLLPSKNDPGDLLIDLSEFESYGIPASVSAPEDVELIFAAWKAEETTRGEGKSETLSRKVEALANASDQNVLKEYAAAIDRGEGTVDYRNAVASYYDDGLYSLEYKCLNKEISAQSFLESIGTVYQSKVSNF